MLLLDKLDFPLALGENAHSRTARKRSARAGLADDINEDRKFDRKSDGVVNKTKNGDARRLAISTGKTTALASVQASVASQL